MDIWSAIVTLYILVMGVNPFSIHRLDDHMETMSHYHTLPNMTGLSDELTQLLSSCMNPRLTQRLTINQILVVVLGDCYSRVHRGLRSMDIISTRSKHGIVFHWTNYRIHQKCPVQPNGQKIV